MNELNKIYKKNIITPINSWDNLLYECQKIVNCEVKNENEIEMIKDNTRKKFITNYLDLVHKNNWTHKMQELKHQEENNIKKIRGFGHYCEICNKLIRIKNGNKNLLEIDKPNIFKQTMKKIQKDEDQSFAIFYLMTIDQKTEQDLLGLYALNEYLKTINEM